MQYNELFAEKELIQASIQAKNDFIAMMSHEIRAPINAVMGMSHLVLESRLTVTQRSQITKIKDSASLLLNLEPLANLNPKSAKNQHRFQNLS